MKSWRALRALVRVELREARRHRRRSWLIVLLVAIPVAAIVGGSIVAVATRPSAEEQRVQAMGRADLRVDAVATHAEFEKVEALLPEQARIERLFVGTDSVRLPGRRLRAKLLAIEPHSPKSLGLATGMVRLQEGRVPVNSGEVALSPVLREGLGVDLGDAVTLDYGPVRTITGVVVDPEETGLPMVLRTAAHVEHGGNRVLLVSLPGDEPAEALADRLRSAEFQVATRGESGNADPFAVSVVFALGCLGFFEAALVMASAFAISLRRRQYEIGLLGATGASPRGMAGAMLISAAAIAGMGGLLGSAVGVGLAAAAHPFLDEWNGRFNGRFEIPSLHLMAAVLLGIGVSVMAVVVPANSAAKLPVRAALSGRRPVAIRAGRWLVSGLGLVLIGLFLVAFAPQGNMVSALLGILVGPVLGIVGFGACSPWLLDWLAKWAARLPLTWRLAVRDAGRFRARNGPVLTAILAGMAMSVTVAVFVGSLSSVLAALPSAYRDDQLLVEGPAAEAVARQLGHELPVRAIAPLAAVYTSGIPVRARFNDAAQFRLPRAEWIACGDEELLRARDLESSRQAFLSGRLLVLNKPAGAGELQLESWVGGRRLAALDIELVATKQRVAQPVFLWNEASLEAFGLEAGPPLNQAMTPWIVRLDAAVTAADLRRAQELAANSPGTTVDAVSLQRPQVQGFYWAVLLVCAVTGVIILLVATALSAAESVGDQRILDSVGAAPGVIRGHLAARAGYLAVLGCLLAVPAGIIPVLAIFKIANVPLEFVMPWRHIFITVFGFPTVVYLSTRLIGDVPSSNRLTKSTPQL